MVWKHRLPVGIALLLTLCFILSLNSFTARSQDEVTNDKDERAPITLKLALWNSDTEFITYITEQVKSFQTVMPHVTVEVEAFSSDGDYLQAMRIRSAASSLPDLFELKPNWLQLFAYDLVPLNDYEVTRRNIVAERFAVDGQVLAIPASLNPEWVYYHPSIFERLELEVPQTWQQFITLLQAIKAGGVSYPLAIGFKDEWSTYPFNEFMPHILSGRESYLSDMAQESKPFREGTPFYTGFMKVSELYKADVTGPDPLSMGWADAVDLFTTGEAAVLAAGQWFLPLYLTKTGGLDDLGAFPLPYRDAEDEPLGQMSFVDHFLGISQESMHQEEALAFMEWYFSPENYKEYVDKTFSKSVFHDVTSANINNDAIEVHSNAFEFIYLPGDEHYTRLSNAIQLDVKALGLDMLVGKSVQQIADQLNERWMKARGESY